MASTPLPPGSPDSHLTLEQVRINGLPTGLAFPCPGWKLRGFYTLGVWFPRTCGPDRAALRKLSRGWVNNRAACLSRGKGQRIFATDPTPDHLNFRSSACLKLPPQLRQFRPQAGAALSETHAQTGCCYLSVDASSPPVKAFWFSLATKRTDNFIPSFVSVFTIKIHWTPFARL